MNVMKFYKTIASFLLLLLPLTMSAQQEKLSMWLKQGTEKRGEKLEVRGKKAEASRRAASDDRLVTVFVRTSETLTEEMLVEYGGKIYAKLGDISIITIPMSQIGKLIENPTVLRVEANQRAEVTLDTVPRVSNICQYRTKTFVKLSLKQIHSVIAHH